MSKFLKESMADDLKEVAEREGDPDLINKIADGVSVTTLEELMAWLEEKKHPALEMEPII
jgi:acetyl-CoA synthase